MSRNVYCDYCETGGDHSNEEPGGIDNKKMEDLIEIKARERAQRFK